MVIHIQPPKTHATAWEYIVWHMATNPPTSPPNAAYGPITPTSHDPWLNPASSLGHPTPQWPMNAASMQCPLFPFTSYANNTARCTTPCPQTPWPVTTPALIAPISAFLWSSQCKGGPMSDDKTVLCFLFFASGQKERACSGSCRQRRSNAPRHHHIIPMFQNNEESIPSFPFSRDCWLIPKDQIWQWGAINLDWKKILNPCAN